MDGRQVLTTQSEDLLLGYPQITAAALQARRRELAAFGIQSMVGYGEKSLGNLQILGSGYVGLVVLVTREQRQFALKIRQTDAKRSSLIPEAEALRQANRGDIAPTVYQASENFILMDFIAGKSFLPWLQQAIAHPDPKGNLPAIHAVLHDLLEQAFQLDQMGLDRDDMRCITKDVIVTDKHKPVLLDFSNASGDRRPRNLTALVQGLFWGTVVARFLQPLFPHCHPERLVPLLRRYKTQPTHANFAQLKQAIALSVSVSHQA